MDSRTSALPHLELLADVVDRFAVELDAAERDGGLDRPVPSLSWTVGEVAAHLAGVHRWCAALVRDGARPQRGSVPAGRDGLGRTYRAEAAAMLDVLRTAEGDRPCWTMDRDDRRAGFWPRRQLHEVVVHLWDVRSVDDPAADAIADVPAEVAADGVDELLQVAPTRLGRSREPLPGPVSLRATDTGTAWLLGTDWLPRPPVPPAEAAAAHVEAPARALLLHVWGRGPLAGVGGDPATLRAFDRARIRA